MSYSICALYHGDYRKLLVRSTRALEQLLVSGRQYMQDVRLLLNDVSIQIRKSLIETAETWSCKYQIHVTLYERLQGQPLKYPLMRRAFYDPLYPVARHVMWFDDDTFFLKAPSQAWWRDLNAQAEENRLVGQLRWFMPLAGNQYAWVKDQPWYNPRYPNPKQYRGKPMFFFTQGAWWVAETDFLRKYDYPWLELRHNGGDSLLGELCRHTEVPRVKWDQGLAINADDKGNQSASIRRGIAEPKLGTDYKGQPLPTDHQKFWTLCRRYQPDGYTEDYRLGFDERGKSIYVASISETYSGHYSGDPLREQ